MDFRDPGMLHEAGLQLAGKDLQRDRAVQAVIRRAVDFSKATRTE